jgi:hypothetical protein
LDFKRGFIGYEEPSQVASSNIIKTQKVERHCTKNGDSTNWVFVEPIGIIE